MELKTVLVLALCLFGTRAENGFQKTGFIEQVRASSPSRIVAGWDATPGQFPHQLSLRMVSASGNVFNCGGTIIHSEWGLTAAHCTALMVTLVIRAGATNLTQPSVMFETTKYYNYPLYDESIPATVQQNDIGLIEFGIKLDFNEFVKPIRLQSSSAMDADYDDKQLTASGYGRVATNGAGTELLNWVYLRGITNSRCWWYYGSIVADSTICTLGYDNIEQGTCQGDSGGPLTVVDEDGVLTQVGVTSFTSGLGCHFDLPSAFVRPGHYHEWYTEVTGINFDWELDAPDSGEDSQSGEDSESGEDSHEGHGGEGDIMNRVKFA